MSEPTTPNEREAFEQWHRTAPGHPYAGAFLNIAWAAWQHRAQRTDPAVASTAAVPEGAEAVAWQWWRARHPEWEMLDPDELDYANRKAIAKPDEYKIRPLFAHPPRESGDAERYRAFFDSGLPVCFMGQEFRSKEECDKAIDAAIRSAAYQGKEGGGA